MVLGLFVRAVPFIKTFSNCFLCFSLTLYFQTYLNVHPSAFSMITFAILYYATSDYITTVFSHLNNFRYFSDFRNSSLIIFVKVIDFKCVSN